MHYARDVFINKQTSSRKHLFEKSKQNHLNLEFRSSNIVWKTSLKQSILRYKLLSVNSRTGNFNNNNDNDNNRNTLLSYKTHLDDSFLSVSLEIIYIILPTNGQNLKNTWNHNRENKIFLFLLT